MSYVVDASAMLAFVNNEPGSEAVESVLDNAIISTVNLAEVGAKLVDKGMTVEEARQVRTSLGLQVRDFDESLAEESVRLRSVTKSGGLSLGDRACLALAVLEKAEVLTTDRIWAELDIGCDIRVIRP